MSSVANISQFTLHLKALVFNLLSNLERTKINCLLPCVNNWVCFKCGCATILHRLRSKDEFGSGSWLLKEDKNELLSYRFEILGPCP